MSQPRPVGPPNPYRVSFDSDFKIRKARAQPPSDAPDKDACKARLGELVQEMSELQRILYAHDNRALLLIFQAMDAAGKDSTIRSVLSGINPAGCQVHSFKIPSAGELAHDFLWRSTVVLPESGRIGVFNRSYYEEVLVVRVHPEMLQAEKLVSVPKKLDKLWAQRYESIRDHEKHLARNDTVILKFWLNVSAEEQRNRLLSRLVEPEKNWKFDEGDIRERRCRDDYMEAYEDALNATSREHAPWYAIPADDKPYMCMTVAEIIVGALKNMDLHYPVVSGEARQRFARMKRQLQRDKR